MILSMVYAHLVCVLVITKASGGTQTVTFDLSTTGKWVAKSERSGSASPSTPLVECSVLSTSARLGAQHYVPEQKSWTCNISTASSLKTYQQQRPRKKILFMICQPRYMCKYTFSLEPGVTNVTLVQMYTVTGRVKEVHYHQAANKIYWITSHYGKTIHWRLASKRSLASKLSVRMKVITFAIDNDSNLMFIMSTDDLNVYGIIKSVSRVLQHFDMSFMLRNRLQLDMYNRKVYYTWRSQKAIHALSYNGTPEIVCDTTSIVKRVKTFVVDAKGSKVYICEGGVWFIYNLNTTKRTSLQSAKGVTCDSPTIHGQEVYLLGHRRIQVISMDSGESITTLILPTPNPVRSAYLPEVFSSPS